MHNSTQNNTKIFSVAVLTISVDPEITDQILQVADSTSWMVVAADLKPTSPQPDDLTLDRRSRRPMRASRLWTMTKTLHRRRRPHDI